MRSTLYLILLILLAAPSLHAQGRKQGTASTRTAKAGKHELLWEISGNGLEKPSYLYGTMHVQDKRAFEFSDSVLDRLHACVTFAAEVRLDSAMRQLLLQIFPEDEVSAEPVDVEESDSEYDSDDEAEGSDDHDASASTDEVEFVETVPADIPDAVDTVESGESGDGMELSDGEESGDSEELSDSEEDTFSPTDLEVADPSYDGMGSGSQPRISDIFDNPLMSDFLGGSRPSRISDRPVFLDAYLTGLALRQGKEVVGLETMDEQLEAAKSMKPMLSGLYTPRLTKGILKGFLPEDMITYYRAGDLDKILLLTSEVFSPEAYSVMIVQRNYKMAERAERYMKKGPTFIAVGAGHLPGPRGVIQLLRDRGFTVRAVKATFTGRADSFQLPPRMGDWPTFTTARGGFSVQMPMEPITVAGDYYDASGVEVFIWSDLLGGLSYIVSYSDLDLTSLRSGADVLLRGFYRDKTTSALRTLGYPTDITVDGMPALEFITKESDGKYRRTRLILRGGRLYTMIAEATRELVHAEDAGQFFDSFHSEQLAEPEWRRDTIRTGECTVELPGRLRGNRYPESLFAGVGRDYTVRDRNSGALYTLRYTRFSDYFHAESEDSLMSYASDRDRLFADSIPAPAKVTRNGIVGHEYEVRVGSYARRARMMLIDGRLFVLKVEAPAAALDASGADRYFDSFHPLVSGPAVDPYSDKSGRIFDALLSADAEELETARSIAEIYPFTAEHLPRIYKIVSTPRPDDDLGMGSTRYILLSRIGTLHDGKTVSVIRDLYPTVPDNGVMRSMMLLALRRIGTDDALQTMADLIIGDPEALNYDGEEEILSWMSLDDGAKIYPKLLTMLNDSIEREGLYYHLHRLLDSGKVSPAALFPYTDRIVADCRASLDRFLPYFKRVTGDSYEDEGEGNEGGEDSSEEDAGGEEVSDEEVLEFYYPRLIYTGTLLGYLPSSPEVDTLLVELINTNDVEASLKGITGFLRHGGTPPETELESLASGPDIRLKLYDILDRAGRVELFPEEYRTQKAFAESLLRQLLESDEETSIDSVVFVGQRTVTSGDHPGRIYLFKYRYDSEAPWLAAISGPQPLDESQVSTSSRIVTTLGDTFDSRTIDGHFEAMMKER
jgi:uncharacterized protein YbaP (TraB family)